MTRHFKPSPPRNPGVRKTRPTNRVRIIGGVWRSRMIEFPDAIGLRPTANRVRETLFNWLGQNLHGKRCLDLFAGSGALGFEAASRGATHVVMVENDKSVMQALENNQYKLGAEQCRLIRQGAREFLAANKDAFDIVFLDPPFASGLMATTMDQLGTHLNTGGLVYAEWHVPLPEVLSAKSQGQWQVVKHGKAGAVHFALLTLGKGET